MSNSIILSCPTLKNELLYALNACNSAIPVYFLPQRLHNDVNELHQYLQNTIDSLDNIDRIYICATGCGGGTIGLKASSAELVLPRTRDCLDILLSGDSLSTLQRDIKGIYYTESWMEFTKNSEIDLDKLTKKLGKEEAETFLRNLFKTLNQFYIIDTGCYDVQKVTNYITPLVKILDGNITMLKGKFKILHKLAAENIDDDFVVVPKGESVQPGSFLPNK